MAFLVFSMLVSPTFGFLPHLGARCHSATKNPEPTPRQAEDYWPSRSQRAAWCDEYMTPARDALKNNEFGPRAEPVKPPITRDRQGCSAVQ